MKFKIIGCLVILLVLIVLYAVFSGGSVPME